MPGDALASDGSDEAHLGAYDSRMDFAGRGLGSFDSILGTHRESDAEAGLEAAHDWLLAASPVAGTA